MTIPKWARWLASDALGNLWVFEDRPSLARWSDKGIYRRYAPGGIELPDEDWDAPEGARFTCVQSSNSPALFWRDRLEEIDQTLLEAWARSHKRCVSEEIENPRVMGTQGKLFEDDRGENQ